MDSAVRGRRFPWPDRPEAEWAVSSAHRNGHGVPAGGRGRWRPREVPGCGFDRGSV